MDAAPGQRVGVAATVGDEQEVLLCSLREGGQESANLDIVLDHYTEFAVHGGAAVHLAGYYMPAYEQEEGAPRQYSGRTVLGGCLKPLARREARNALCLCLSKLPCFLSCLCPV